MLLTCKGYFFSLNIVTTLDEDQEVSIEETRLLMKDDLHRVIKMMFIDLGCWYRYIENDFVMLGIESTIDNYHNSCLYCTRDINKFKIQIKRNGITGFLTKGFIQSGQGDRPTIKLLDELKKHDKVGKVIYGRNTYVPPARKFLHSTILSLFASGMIELLIDNEEKMKPKCRMFVDDDCMPLYIKNNVWEHMLLC